MALRPNYVYIQNPRFHEGNNSNSILQLVELILFHKFTIEFRSVKPGQMFLKEDKRLVIFWKYTVNSSSICVLSVSKCSVLAKAYF